MNISYPDTAQVRIDFTAEELNILDALTCKLAGIANELDYVTTCSREFEANGTTYSYEDLIKVYNMLDDFQHSPIIIW